MSNNVWLASKLRVWQAAYEQGRDLPAEVLCRDEDSVSPSQIAGLAQAIDRLRKTEKLSADPLARTDPMLSDSCGGVQAPRAIGRYRVEGTLGEGGFGRVYLGFDDQLQRQVAIKVPHRRHLKDKAIVDAYLHEARTVASLDHPHIVPVYDVGSTAEYPYFHVAKRIAGNTLARHTVRRRLPYTETARLLATIADALHYAHLRGVVHRDVKPGNILIDTAGRPYLTDFGLALSERNSAEAGGYHGTPAYMSPEQARGEGHRVDGRSDIFSLGVVLYELLAGRRPFASESRAKLLEQIATVEPWPPREIDDTIPRELERVCLKALSKRVIDRYSTAHDLAEDLFAWIGASATGPQPLRQIVEPSSATDSFCPAPLDSETKVSTPVSPGSDRIAARVIPHCPQNGLHSHRALGCHRHYRRAGRIVAAGRAAGA